MSKTWYLLDTLDIFICPWLGRDRDPHDIEAPPALHDDDDDNDYDDGDKEVIIRSGVPHVGAEGHHTIWLMNVWIMIKHKSDDGKNNQAFRYPVDKPYKPS